MHPKCSSRWSLTSGVVDWLTHPFPHDREVRPLHVALRSGDDIALQGIYFRIWPTVAALISILLSSNHLLIPHPLDTICMAGTFINEHFRPSL